MSNDPYVGTSSYILADVPSASREIGSSVVEMKVHMSEGASSKIALE
ncbi:MAG: hypothetical protein HGJ98_13155 [Desulfosporosinus sp.]|nr:hypothetical protein [Desulfosporosinus sp.]